MYVQRRSCLKKSQFSVFQTSVKIAPPKLIFIKIIVSLNYSKNLNELF